MDEGLICRYWCYMCSQRVNPVIEIEIKCPFCNSGFVEEMSSTSNNDDDDRISADLGSDRALSLWARILLGMLGSSSSSSSTRRRRTLRREEDDEEEEVEVEVEVEEAFQGGETELERDLESIQRRRRRSSAAILQLLQGLPGGILSGSENMGIERDHAHGEEEEEEEERVILINPMNQSIILQGSFDVNHNQNPPGSLGNYLIGPGFELLLQHLTENDPNIHGTPPARKEAVQSMPNVTIGENLQCSVCLEDFEIGSEAKEMPCKHKFHSGCIFPWLELHSSCPVCRFLMPTIDGSKSDADGSGNSTSTM